MNLPSVATYITVEATRYRSAVSEFLIQTMGKSINYLLDRIQDVIDTIEGTSFSEVIPTLISSGQMPYTVPSGYTFTGTVTAVSSVAATTYSVSADAGGGSFARPDGNGSLAMSHAIKTSSGSTINVTTGGGTLSTFYATGILHKATTVTIP